MMVIMGNSFSYLTGDIAAGKGQCGGMAEPGGAVHGSLPA